MAEAAWLVLFGAVLVAEAVHQRRLERERRYRVLQIERFDALAETMRPVVAAFAQLSVTMEQTSRAITAFARAFDQDNPSGRDVHHRGFGWDGWDG